MTVAFPGLIHSSGLKSLSRSGKVAGNPWHDEATIAQATLASLGGRYREEAASGAIERLTRRSAELERCNARARAAIAEVTVITRAAPDVVPALPINEKR
ncbi:hypothetical protein [uncultured Halomonas sp.]|uniref:hypothetical protein n=1 Tax=uncultured Halomonas sp. TaxID=173971 RepID=UPI0026354B35|nr:hypothetical protein [uncultured Halomonas sp.]